MANLPNLFVGWKEEACLTACFKEFLYAHYMTLYHFGATSNKLKLNSQQESTLYQILASQIMDHPSSTASAHHRDVKTVRVIKGTVPKDQAHRRQTDTNLMDQRSNTHTKSNQILQVDTQQTKTNQTPKLNKQIWKRKHELNAYCFPFACTQI